MKKHIIPALITVTALVSGFSLGKVSTPEGSLIRVMTGHYYDYLVIETVYGNTWLLDEGAEPFEDGELVQVSFDTKGTESVLDDEIIDVRSIDSRY